MKLITQPKSGNLRLILIASLLLVIAIEPFGVLAQGPARRPLRRHALLVGINKYNLPAPQAQPTVPQLPTGKEQQNLRRRFQFADLYGPRPDVDAMGASLKEYGFSDIHVLEDDEATRERILAAIQRYLIDAASPGDVCLFYYAGHGSRVRNSLGDPKGYDESLVPSDSNIGAPDIRDKELARLFLKAIQKGVTLTVIADSCSSGTIARGENDTRTRGLSWDETDVHDPPGFTVPPEDTGALILTACQDYEEAQERPRNQVYRGNFTYALNKVLEDPATKTQTAEQVFQRVVSLMQSERQNQRPVMTGDYRRRKGTLFDAQPAVAPAATAVVVNVSEDGKVVLGGGVDRGFGINTELKRVRVSADRNPVKLQIKQMEGLTRCRAIVIGGDSAGIRPGDQFVIERWSAQPAENLKVWLPPSLQQVKLDVLAKQIKDFRKASTSRWADDPTQAVNLRLVRYEPKGWTITDAQGKTETVGADLALNRLANGQDQTPLFVSLPPPMGLKEKLRLGHGSAIPSISIVDSPGNADYTLEGRLMGTQIEYAWVRPGAVQEGRLKGGTPLPTRSDWYAVGLSPKSMIAAAQELIDAAVVLGRIHGWLSIQSPGDLFPYRLALRETGTNEIIRGSKVYEGQRYDLILVPDPRAFRMLADEHRAVEQRRIYVFSIDTYGDSYLLFNRGGNVENLYPEHPEKIDPASPPTEPILLGRPGMIELQEPFGLDTYILLASQQDIPDPFIFEFRGVRTRGEPRGGSALVQLIYGLGSGTRAAPVPDPPDWSIDRVMIRSTPRNRH
ncbi:MAG: caspase family protein [Blastocatellia bacterium]